MKSMYTAWHILPEEGIVENLGRILPEGLGAVIDTPAIEVPAIFALISSWAR